MISGANRAGTNDWTARVAPPSPPGAPKPTDELARAAGEAVVPRLPAVALHKAEPGRVRGEPGVCLPWPEVKLGGVTVEALPGRRHPLRVRVRGEQARLLGIGAEAARDAEEDAGLPASRGRHSVEGQRHIRPHRLALAVGERTVIPASACERGQAARAWTRRQLRGGICPEWHALPPTFGEPHAGIAAQSDLDAGGRETVAGEGHIRRR